MQQGDRGPVRHAAVAVGGAGHNALEEAEDGTDGFGLADGGDELHLRCAGIGETGIDAHGFQGLQKGLCAVHRDLRLG